jgi:hypothetical protein
MIAIKGDVARDIQQILRWAGDYDGPITGNYDTATKQALSTLIGKENFEERFDETRGTISRQVVEILRTKFSH